MTGKIAYHDRLLRLGARGQQRVVPGRLPDIDLPGGGVRVLSSIAPPCSLIPDRGERKEESIDPAIQWYLLENLELFPEPQAPSLAAGPGPLGLGRELPYASTISHSSDANKTFACDLSPS